VAAVLMLALLRAQLTDNLDQSLGDRADTIIAAGVADARQADLSHDQDLYVQVVGADGAVRATSSNLGSAGSIAPLQPGVRTISGIAGVPGTFRVLTRQVATPVGPLVVHVANSLDDVNEPVGILSRLLVLTVPAVVALLGVLTWWLTSRTLRPVETMRVELAEIGSTNLGRRVAEPRTGDEIDRLAHTINATLDRLEDAVQRQQRFVADASHELRTPLTRIRSTLEVGLARPELAEPRATMFDVLGETVALQHLVNDLLRLANSDAAVPESELSCIDLDDIVLREVRRVNDRGRTATDTTGVGAVQLLGDGNQLARAVRNLLDNAERYAATTVTVTLGEADGTATLTVTDDGPGIPPDLRERVFQRFTRLDDARTRDTGGFGLGLAITRDIVERHHGTIRIDGDAATRFVVTLPVARP
jgi:signal transduction histidine kinase